MVSVVLVANVLYFDLVVCCSLLLCCDAFCSLDHISFSFRELANNQLSGTLPTQLLFLTQLQTLDISHNNLHGFLPPEWRQQLTNLTVMCDFSGLQDDECLHETIDLVSTPLFAVMCGLGGVVMCVVAGLGVFVWRNRGHPCIRASSPMFSVLTLVGLGLLVGAVPAIAVSMWHVSKEARTVACRGAAGLVSFGLVIVMGCVIFRNYIIWRIFFNSRMREMGLHPIKLLRVVCVVALLNGGLMTPVIRRISGKNNSGWCKIDRSDASRSAFVVVGVVNILFMATLAIGAVAICVRIRNVPSRFNETEQVGKATYNLVTFGAAMVLVGLLTNNNVSRLLALNLTIVMCVMSFIAFVYVPKVSVALTKRVVSTASSKSYAAVYRPPSSAAPKSDHLTLGRQTDSMSSRTGTDLIS
eukprot:c12314_g1_i5.p1 GENE.c12314_g1_i5~~c12314_g1_i5.p1  ORF type:complete len:413 (+),score=104.87 c12314_g1_i5:903-2141(+)